jgi:hypothetical protein
MQQSAVGLDEAVEEHPLDADVVVEPLDVADDAARAARMEVERGRGVRRERDVVGLREGDGAEEAGDAETARRES